MMESLLKVRFSFFKMADVMSVRAAVSLPACPPAPPVVPLFAPPAPLAVCPAAPPVAPLPLLVTPPSESLPPAAPALDGAPVVGASAFDLLEALEQPSTHAAQTPRAAKTLTRLHGDDTVNIPTLARGALGSGEFKAQNASVKRPITRRA
jgi:hypothetical protein